MRHHLGDHILFTSPLPFSSNAILSLSILVLPSPLLLLSTFLIISWTTPPQLCRQSREMDWQFLVQSTWTFNYRNFVELFPTNSSLQMYSRTFLVSTSLPKRNWSLIANSYQFSTKQQDSRPLARKFKHQDTSQSIKLKKCSLPYTLQVSKQFFKSILKFSVTLISLANDLTTQFTE